ncbi:MAG: hypothetical protein ACREJ2_13740 [Planctomycetota bacterium]
MSLFGRRRDVLEELAGGWDSAAAPGAIEDFDFDHILQTDLWIRCCNGAAVLPLPGFILYLLWDLWITGPLDFKSVTAMLVLPLIVGWFLFDAAINRGPYGAVFVGMLYLCALFLLVSLGIGGAQPGPLQGLSYIAVALTVAGLAGLVVGGVLRRSARSLVLPRGFAGAIGRPFFRGQLRNAVARLRTEGSQLRAQAWRDRGGPSHES